MRSFPRALWHAWLELIMTSGWFATQFVSMSSVVQLDSRSLYLHLKLPGWCLVMTCPLSRVATFVEFFVLEVSMICASILRAVSWNNRVWTSTSTVFYDYMLTEQLDHQRVTCVMCLHSLQLNNAWPNGVAVWTAMDEKWMVCGAPPPVKLICWLQYVLRCSADLEKVIKSVPSIDLM
jgi:hypothetical protein